MRLLRLPDWQAQHRPASCKALPTLPTLQEPLSSLFPNCTFFEVRLKVRMQQGCSSC